MILFAVIVIAVLAVLWMAYELKHAPIIEDADTLTAPVQSQK